MARVISSCHQPCPVVGTLDGRPVHPQSESLHDPETEGHHEPEDLDHAEGDAESTEPREPPALAVDQINQSEHQMDQR